MGAPRFFFFQSRGPKTLQNVLWDLWTEKLGRPKNAKSHHEGSNPCSGPTEQWESVLPRNRRQKNRRSLAMFHRKEIAHLGALKTDFVGSGGNQSCKLLGACTMTTNFSTMKLALSKFFCSGVPKKNSVFGRFSSLPPIPPPPSKTQMFIFSIVSPSLSNHRESCDFGAFRSRPIRKEQKNICLRKFLLGRSS